MIHGSIEDALLGEVVGLNFDARELTVPSLIGSFNGSVEVPCGQFGSHVGFSLVDIDGRERHLYEQRLRGVAYCEHHALHRVKALHGYGLRKLDVKVDAAVCCPSVGAAESGEAGGCLLCEEAVIELVPSYALREIECELCLGTVLECVAMEAATFRSGKFHEHFGFVKAERVIARVHLLVVVREACRCLLAVLDGQESHVAETSDAGA